VETVILLALVLLVIVVALVFVQFKSLTARQQSSSEQTMQLFTILKSDLEAAVKSVAETTRSNNESMARTLEIVSDSLTRSLDSHRTSTNSQIEQLANQVSQLANLVGRQVESFRGSVEERLNTIGSQIGGQLSEANRLFSSLKQDFGELKESSNNMLEIGKQINQLQNILSSPKLRGNLGETLLEELVKQVIPQGFYEFQYTFRDGSKVDAVIKTSERIIPIDSKFPKEEFERYVNASSDSEKNSAMARLSKAMKDQIDDIAEKYIKPSENTFDFAIMFIPSESMYYELLMHDSDRNGAYRYAIGKHVIPTSPNSFYAYIQAIAVGLKGMQIEKNAKQIRDQLAQLENSLSKFDDHFETLGTHLKNAANKYNDSHEALGRFRDRLQGIAKIEDGERERIG
jgi:DNA recombination protein RmuC